MTMIPLRVIGCVGIFLIPLLAFADLGFAQIMGGGEFGTRMNSLTSNIVNIIVPLVAILGLVYAGILGATGDPDAKRRMIWVVIFSVVCFLAKFAVQWLQLASGGGI